MGPSAVSDFNVGSVRFNYVDIGHGVPFVFLHGLGGDVRQVLHTFRPPSGVRLLSFDFRGHGATVPTPEGDAFSFETFGDDVLAFLNYLRLDRPVVGGIALGAAVALNVALRHPRRVSSLVMARPAWLDGPMPKQTVALFDLVARLLRAHGQHASGHLEASDAFQTLAARYPDAGRALLGQTNERRAVEAIARLERLPREQPIAELRQAAELDVPTLVLAHRGDPLHPFEFGMSLARAMPDARFVRLTPRSVARDVHAAEIQAELEAFLTPARLRRVA
jgi:pimeloyl-ACP methyl ester carboxylesterase